MQPKARMTFRFEPPKPVRPQREPEKPPAAAGQDRPPELAGEAAQDLPTEAGYEAAGPLQDDPYTLEELIRRSGTFASLPAAKESGRSAPPAAHRAPLPAEDEPVPEWLPETGPPVIELLPPGSSEWKDGPSWWRVFASVAGAIATGALFGYLVLTLFTGDSLFPAGTAQGTDKPAQASADPDASPVPSGGNADGAGIPSSTAHREEIPGQTYYLLQYGVFRSEESMGAAIEQLKERRLPGTPDRMDGYRVYVGAAESKAEAESLAGQLSGLEVFVKTVSLNAIPPAIADNELSAFLSRSQELLGGLSRLSVKVLQEEAPGPLDPADSDALKGVYRDWQPYAASVDDLPAGAKEAAERIVRELNEAMASLEAYERGISRFHLWNIQSDVTEAIIADRLLRTSLI